VEGETSSQIIVNVFNLNDEQEEQSVSGRSKI